MLPHHFIGTMKAYGTHRLHQHSAAWQGTSYLA